MKYNPGDTVRIDKTKNKPSYYGFICSEPIRSNKPKRKPRYITAVNNSNGSFKKQKAVEIYVVASRVLLTEKNNVVLKKLTQQFKKNMYKIRLICF